MKKKLIPPFSLPILGLIVTLFLSCNKSKVEDDNNNNNVPPSAKITTLKCGAIINGGILEAGIPLLDVSVIIPYEGGNGLSYAKLSIPSAGVSGLTATLDSGKLVNGSGSLTLIITGTPASEGTATFALSIGGQNCTVSRAVLKAPPSTIATKIKQDLELSYLRSAMGIAGLADTLSKSGTAFTFFAPVNASLDSLTYDGKSYANWLTDTAKGFTPETIKSELSYHIVKGTYRSGDIPAGAKNLKLSTINNPSDSLFVTKAPNGSVYVNGIKVDDVKKDIIANNGVIHKLEFDKNTGDYGYLELPSEENAYDLIKSATNLLDSLAKMIDRAAIADPGLIPALKTNIVTIAAPVNASFVDFVKAFGGDINKINPAVLLNVLKNHIIPSREFRINFAIAGASAVPGIPALSGTKLVYTIANFGGQQYPALYILKDKPVPILATDYMFRTGVLHLIYGVILDK